MENNQTGTFIISLDFELYWGVRDKLKLESYQPNLLGVRLVVPGLLSLFSQKNIHATWVTVGFLFFDGKRELLENLPDIKPAYFNVALSPYGYISQTGESEATDPLHFAPSLIKQIIQTPNQEIGSHTFSHYYALEKGQTAENFKADLEASVKAAQKFGITLKSLVFPRNQINLEYLAIAKALGFRTFRGTEKGFAYKPALDENQNIFKRIFRLKDSYINLSGFNTYEPIVNSSGLVNLPSSRFLRPYSKALSFLEDLRLRRILIAMTHAAKNGEVFHLWWHPHNFGVNRTQNFEFLEKILNHFQTLQKTYGMRSLNMGEAAEIFNKQYANT